MIKNIFGVISAIIIILSAIMFFRTGAHKKVEITRGPMPDFQIYFKKHMGPYHEIIKDLNAVEEAMKAMELDCKKTFGYFLSDPKVVEHDKLVSLTGCIYEASDAPQVLVPPKDVETDFIGGKELCYIGKFSGSPSLTAVKVYPKLKKMAQKDRKPLSKAALEVYEVTGDDSVNTTVYLCTN